MGCSWLVREACSWPSRSVGRFQSFKILDLVIRADAYWRCALKDRSEHQADAARPVRLVRPNDGGVCPRAGDGTFVRHGIWNRRLSSLLLRPPAPATVQISLPRSSATPIRHPCARLSARAAQPTSERASRILTSLLPRLTVQGNTSMAGRPGGQHCGAENIGLGLRVRTWFVTWSQHPDPSRHSPRLRYSTAFTL